MPESFELLSPGVPLDVVFPGGVLKATYNAGKIPPDWTLPPAGEQQAHLAALIDLVCRVVSAWDFCEGGTPVPIGPQHREEARARVDIGVFVTVGYAILEALLPNRETSTSSRGTSPGPKSTAAGTRLSTRSTRKRTARAADATARRLTGMTSSAPSTAPAAT